MSETSGFPWGATLMGLLFILVLGSAVGTPFLLRARREARERWACGALQTLSTAETDFRANDRDRNKISDFWTGDVAGLHDEKEGPQGSAMKLIPPSIARSDAQAPHPEPCRGFLIRAMDQDKTVPEDPEGTYRMDTDGSGRKVHHRTRFGFCAYPEFSGAGRYSYIINENNTIYWLPPEKCMTHWPDDDELKRKVLGHE